MAETDKIPTLNSFPSDFVNPKLKLGDDYGLAYSKAIWGSYHSNFSAWTKKKNRWIMSRKYAEGLQSTEKYVGRLDLADSSYLNLDLTPIPIIPKYVDNIVGKLINQAYKIQCEAIDPASRTKEDDAMREMKTKMFLKKYSDEMEQISGIPLVPHGEEIPDTPEELEIYFALNYKAAVALAMELAIDFVMTNNDFENSRERVLRDLVNLKTAAISLDYDKDFNIIAENEDPVDIITPYSKYDDYRNIPWIAVVKQFTIGQIAKMTDKFKEEELFEIAKSYAGKLGNVQWNNMPSSSYEGYYNAGAGWSGRPYDNFNIQVLRYWFKSVDTNKWESKESDAGLNYFNKKKYNYKAEEGKKGKSQIIEKGIENRYEGFWIIGSDHTFNYKKSSNVPHEKIKNGYNPKTMLPIRMISPNIYDMENKSLTERMIPHADQMTLISLKMQQFLMKATPPGIWIDVDAANEALAAMGAGVNKPIELIKMYTQTGSLVGSRKFEDGKPINGKAVEILPNGLGDINGLILAYNSEMQKINDIIGYNSATDGSTPNVEALVGTQKLAVQSTNNTLRPLNNAYTRLVKLVAQDLTLMIQDKFEFAGGLEGFERAIGKSAIDILEVGKDIPMCEFGIKVEFLPDEVERAEIEQYIQISLTTVPPQIDMADALMVKQILKSNVKLATQMLILRKKKYQEERMAEASANAQSNAEQQAMGAQAAAEAEVQKTAQVYQMEQQQEMFKFEAIERPKMELAHQHKLAEIEKQNEGKVDVAEKSNDGKVMTAAMSATKPVGETK